MDEKTLLELKGELDSVAIQICLTDDFVQTLAVTVFDALGDTIAQERLRALKEDFLTTLKQQQYQSLDDLKETIPLSKIEQARFRVHRNVSYLGKLLSELP
jgi:hypothetical protein